jgi:Ser/Thr protein kinase RdoA (MazF antagonist)
MAAARALSRWKELLRDGTAPAGTAAAVGETLGRLHAATADRPELAARFATAGIFEAIRIEPYLLATAHAHPEVGRGCGCSRASRAARRACSCTEISARRTC